MISPHSPAVPAQSVPYQSTNVQPLDAAGLALVKGTKEYVETNLAAAAEASRKKFQELKKFAEEGHWSMSFAGLLSAIFVGVVNITDMISNLVGLAPVKMLLNIYLLLFSIVIVILEYKKLLINEKYIRLIERQAHFLTQPYGRGYFYIFIGLLQMILGSIAILSFCAGIFSIAVGSVIVRINTKTHEDLQKLRDDKYTIEDIREKFKVADVQARGKLGTGELAVLCHSLGHKLTRSELEVAVMTMDANRDGEVSLHEFLDWWCGYDEDEEGEPKIYV